jgi:type VI secretion system protein ImpA
MLQCAAAVSAEALRLDEPVATAGEEGSSASPQGGRVQNPGQISSREDAIRALEKVCEYIEKAEPANPAPLFIRRAQRLMTRNFMEIIQDLAPDSLAEIQKLAGLEEK